MSRTRPVLASGLADDRIVSALAGLAVVWGSTPTALALAGLGALALVSARYRRSRRLFSLGALGLFSGVVAAGLAGTPEGPLLAATVGAVVLWERQEAAVTDAARPDIGGESGRRASVGGLVAGILVGAAALVCLLVYRLVSGTVPVGVVVALLVGATLLVSVLAGGVE